MTDADHIRELWAERRKLQRLLWESRQYVADAGNDEDPETQTISAALLAEIDTALAPHEREP